MVEILHNDYRNILAEIADVAGFLWERGWAERNGGNISVDITDLASTTGNKPYLKVSFPIHQTELAGRSFFVKVGGARMCDVSRQPDQNVLLIKINNNLKGYQVIWGGKDRTARPTSEFSSHLKVHQYLRQKNLPQKVFLHTHPTHLIALSHIKEYCTEKALNALLCTMHPEVKVHLPKGIGFVPYCCPGSEELANATVKALHKHRVVVWEKHGCAAVGNNLIEAFDLIDVVNKAAQIFFICNNAGYKPDGLSKEQLAELDKKFNRK
jgi:rhamnulose-1-phosphate aldolase